MNPRKYQNLQGNETELRRKILIRAYQNSRPDRPSFTSGHLTTSRSRKKEMELTQNKNCMNQSFHK